MDAKLERKYTFLTNKYNELLLPTFFMVMSEKECAVIDVIIIGFLLGPVQLSVVNLASPMTYLTGIFYILFGQGGNLLALRAQSHIGIYLIICFVYLSFRWQYTDVFQYTSTDL